MTGLSGMTGSPDPSGYAAMRLQAVEAGLAAVGLSTRLHESPAGSDLTATLRRPGRRDIEVVIDDDGYTELRYWASLNEPPTHTVAIIMRALSVITEAENAAVDVAPQPTVGVAGYDGAVTQRAGESGMSGPEDRVATPERPDHARPPEADHPREAHPQPSDLRSRLERLPEGHPSSPHRDDGTRKSSPPELRKYELPLPDELRSASDQAGQDLAAEDKPRVNPDGSWQWKDGRLTPEESRAADQVLAHCHDSEGRDAQGNYGDHGLTPAMRRIEAQLDRGRLADNTEQHALKEPDRFKEKLARLIVWNPGADVHSLAAEIHDGVRYTFVSDTEHYVESFWDTSAKLEGSGFELIARTNTWGNDEYKGVNTRWRDPNSNLVFEVQLHTHESLDAKERTHKAYERINDTRTPAHEIEILREYQREISAKVPVPHGWQEISDYRKDIG